MLVVKILLVDLQPLKKRICSLKRKSNWDKANKITKTLGGFRNEISFAVLKKLSWILSLKSDKLSSLKWCRNSEISKQNLSFKPSWHKIKIFYYGEFDPGSGWTLAAGLIHASRGRSWVLALNGNRRTGA